MKKIIRLTESDLTRLVRRIIKEQTYDVRSAAQQIVDSVEGLGTDEGTLRRVLGELLKVDDQTLKSFYNEFSKLTKMGSLVKFIKPDVNTVGSNMGGGKLQKTMYDVLGFDEANRIMTMAAQLDRKHVDSK
jgi:hypothetical protein